MDKDLIGFVLDVVVDSLRTVEELIEDLCSTHQRVAEEMFLLVREIHLGGFDALH